MKKPLFIAAIFIVCFILFSFYNNTPKSVQSRDIVIAFITYNGYGNNLYIDNILTGKQPDHDLTVTSILNIPYDTTYSVFTSGTDTVSPVVTITNIGRFNITDSTLKVFLNVYTNSGKYFDTLSMAPLNAGITISLRFRTLTYNIGSQLYFKAYTSYSDSNRTNDTLNQYSIILPGYKRNVLFEEFTSNASPACANNNDELDAFINANIGTVTAIKYHLPLGVTGSDTFYSANPLQNNERSRYYYTPSFPTTIVDGKLFASIPYGDSMNLYTPFLKRLSTGTPVSMSVTDERLKGDSIKTTININIASSVKQGNYRLRVNAIERYISDSASNGETNFYDVFRKFYPDSNGFTISTQVGSYQYTYTYYREPAWVDAMLYTAAFIQNDNTREVINCAKGRNIVFNIPKNISKVIYEKPDIPDNLNLNEGKRELLFSTDTIQTSLNIELFEAFFPPLGWRVFNQDGYITFNQYSGANGPTFGGVKSVIMDFFDYNIPGQKDSMYSKLYTGLLSIDTVQFDYAYAQYNSTNIDSLIVLVSTDGGVTFPTEVFRKGGLALATAPQNTSFFVPTNNTEWRSFRFGLTNIVSVSNSAVNIPGKFELKQNYPNPFNPNTVIGYQLAVSSFASLKVYDILGKEVAILVNEKQNAGSYNYQFSTINYHLSSGIYFYKLTTEGFSDTKRMVLIK